MGLKMGLDLTVINAGIKKDKKQGLKIQSIIRNMLRNGGEKTQIR